MTETRTEEKEVEVIAEKSRKIAYVFLALSLLGVIVAAVGIILYLAVGFKINDIVMQAVEIGLTALGAVLIAVFTALFVRQLYRSYALIVLKEGKLVFSDGTVCSPNEVTAVEKGNNKLTVIINGERKEIDGVANCDKAYRKLCVLTGNSVTE